MVWEYTASQNNVICGKSYITSTFLQAFGSLAKVLLATSGPPERLV